MTKKKNKENPGLFRFLFSKIFLVNVFIALIVIALLLVITLSLVNAYSRHGDSRTVPDITGMNKEEAVSQLKNASLEFAVIDSTFNPDERPSTVLNQDPLPNSKVKSGRTIYVVLNMSEAMPVAIPNIEIGTSFISVREVLASRGLKVGEISYKPFQYKDVFLEMRFEGKRIKAGEEIAKGSKVDLVLGNGLGETNIEVPDLTGFTYIEAVNLIQLKNLNLGSVIGNGMITDTLNAYVVKQYPAYAPDSYINLGSMMDLWISDEPPIMEDTPEDEF
ncbi:MAG TPA: PASTA domain-containing protein [Chitinophagales bacterium]|nr:PASTA domain-containing protein [Chitinophagales bacterium]